VRRALLVPVLGAATALAVIAAPALSLERWRPQPVDFELAVPADALLGTRATSGVVSKPLEAPKRFNLVGLRWRGGGELGIALRARKDDGDWTPWTPAHPDDPVWVGEADWVQYRISRRVRGLRLHFVNVQGTATAADRLRTAIRGAANAGVLAVAGVGPAGAAEPQPEIVPRDEWGGNQCRPRSAPELGEVKAAFVHHTVSANDYTAEEAPDVVLGICRFHRNSNGWNDIGYNFLVDKFGTVYEGRAGGIDQAVVGAQAQGYNAQSTGIANLGTHTGVEQTSAALDAMAGLIRWKLPLHGTATGGSVVLTSTGGSSNKFPAGSQVRVPKVAGHRDTGQTECPGDALYGQLRDLRRRVGTVPAAADGTTTTLGLTPSRVEFGGEALVSGRVLAAAGQPLPNAPVSVQRRSGGRWVSTASAITAADGSFGATVKPRLNTTVRARFAGDGVSRASNSVQRLLGVRPLVEVVRPPSRGRVGRPVVVTGTVGPRKRTVYLVVRHRRNGRWGRPGVRPVRARRGQFEASFLPGRAGRWRFYVATKADAKNLRGASEAYELRVS
jgi:N-acetylmuramoyl-L-alanine amidase